MSLLTKQACNTHIYQAEQETGLFKKISIMVELNEYNLPHLIKEEKLDQLENEIIQLLDKYFSGREIIVNSLTNSWKKNIQTLSVQQ